MVSRRHRSCMIDGFGRNPYKLAATASCNNHDFIIMLCLQDPALVLGYSSRHIFMQAEQREKAFACQPEYVHV